MTQKKMKIKKKGGALGRIASIAGAFHNHPQWYEAYPLKHLMGINFGARERLGKTIPANVAAGASTPDIDSAPDCRFNLDLVVPGDSNAFMESMQILMNKLRAASGSNITYTIYDLGAFVLNAREIYAYYSQNRRTILCTRITDIYDQDAHIKYALMSNGRVTSNLADITENLASDTTRLNRLAGVISAMIPIKMSLLERTAWLFSNIFADSHTAKFSTKMFCLANVTNWKAVDTDGDQIPDTITGSANDSKSCYIKLTDNIAELESMIGAFTENIQNSRIAGDLMKAFGAFFTKVEDIDENTKILPIYDEAALTQIQNGSILPSQQASCSVTVTSATTTVSYPTALTVDQTKILTGTKGNHILNSYKDALTPGEIVSLTRLAAEFDVTSGTPNVVNVTSCGTEIITAMLWADSMTAGVVSYTTYDATFSALTTTLYACPNVAQVLANWSRDDWAPLIVPMFECVANTPASKTKVCTMFDLSNWASIDKNNLDVFHQAACLSLTATPVSIREQSNFRFLS